MFGKKEFVVKYETEVTDVRIPQDDCVGSGMVLG
jgi:hypothetical protein